MRYMLLLYGPEPTEEAPEDPNIMEAYGVFTEEVVTNGVMVHGEALELSPTAKSLRLEGGRVMVTDGPFVETHEQLGGFYILECASLEEAQQYAAKIPAASDGRVEVRPMAGHDTRIHDDKPKPRYMALIYGDESRFAPFGSEGQRAIVSGHQRFTSELMDTGEFVTGDGLHLTKDATSVSVREGATVVSDGPYAETREVLGGFYEFACESLERAIDLGSKLLFNDNGGIEVRPVMDLGDM